MACRLILVLIAGVCSFGKTHAQLPALIGSAGIESAYATTADRDSGFILAISFQNTVVVTQPGNVSLTATGPAADMGLIKYDRLGNTVWAKRIGGAATTEVPYAVAVDSSGAIYVAGYFGAAQGGGPAAGSFDPAGNDVVYSLIGNDAFLARYSTTGALRWVVPLGNPNYNSHERIYDMAVDPGGNAFVIGTMQGQVNFNPLGSPLVVTQLFDTAISLFVARYDSLGQCNWVFLINAGVGNIDETYGTLDLDANGGLVIAGNFSNSGVVVAPGSGTAYDALGGTDIFIARCNPVNGAAYWTRAIATPASESVMPGSLRASPDGSVYLTGKLSGDNIVNTGLGIIPHGINSSSLFLTRFTTAGNTHWATGFNSGTGDGGHSLGFDSDANVYLGGWMNGTVNFGNGALRTAHSGTADAFLAKFNPDGICQWAFNFGGENQQQSTGVSMVSSVAVDSENNVIATGMLFGSMADVDPTPQQLFMSSAGNADAFVLMFTRLGALWPDTADLSLNSLAVFSAPGFHVYPNPVCRTLTVEAESGSGSLSIYNVLGQRLDAHRVLAGKTTIDMSGYTAGVYVLQFVSASSSVLTRVIKN